MRKKRIIVYRLLLAVFSVVCVLLVLEVFMRVLPPAPAPDPMGDRSRFFYLIDDECRHPWSRGATNVIRIAVVGDSFSAGVGVQEDDRYAERLERQFNGRRGLPPVEVRIWAECGTSTYQQIGLVDKALKWRPQIVVLGICLNDTEDKTKPIELHRWRQRLMPQIPVDKLRYSRALGWIYTKLKWWECHKMERRYYRRLYNPSYSGFMRFCEAVAIMNDKCAEANAKFVPMIFPLMSDTDSFRKGDYVFEYAHEAIHRRFEELHIPYLDLLEAFREAAPDRLVTLPKYDPHPNEIAHRMAADALMQFLTDGGYIAPEYMPPQHGSAMLERQRWRQAIQADESLVHGSKRTP